MEIHLRKSDSLNFGIDYMALMLKNFGFHMTCNHLMKAIGTVFLCRRYFFVKAWGKYFEKTFLTTKHENGLTQK